MLKALKRNVFLLVQSDSVAGGGEEESNVIPVIAPQLRVDPSRVEDLQLCYAVPVPDGESRMI